MQVELFTYPEEYFQKIVHYLNPKVLLKIPPKEIFRKTRAALIQAISIVRNKKRFVKI